MRFLHPITWDRPKGWDLLIPLYFLLLGGAGCASSPYSHFNQSLLDIELGKASPAEQRLAESLKQNPRHAESWNQLGILAFERQEWDLAKNCFQKAFSLDRLHPAYPRNLAMVFAEDKQYSVAEELLERALTLEPANVETLVAFAKVKMLQNQNPEAEQFLFQARHVDPANKEAQSLLARLMKKDG